MNVRDSAAAEFRRAFAPASEALTPTDAGLLGLVMLFVRTYHSDGWQDWRAHRFEDVYALVRYLPEDIFPEAAPSTARHLSRAALAAITESVDVLASRIGETAAFRLVLEEYAWSQDILTPESVAVLMSTATATASAETVYDPFCRAGEILIAAAGEGRKSSLRDDSARFFGEMPNHSPLEIAQMNTRMHQVNAQLGMKRTGYTAFDSSTNKFSRVLTNPPFNAKLSPADSGIPWRYASPPKSNANFAWLQYAVERLEPGGRAAVVMANGAASSSNPRERHIREAMASDGCIEGLIALPQSLFRRTGVPVMLWLLNPPGTRQDELLFIDASAAGHMTSRTQRDLDRAEISEIAATVNQWRSGQPTEKPTQGIRSVSIPLSEIRKRDFILNPAAYISEPEDGPSSAARFAEVRRLFGQLEIEYGAARDKDAAALETLKRLTR